MADPKVQIVITADGSQAGREVAKAGSELLKLGVGSVTAGNLLADLGRRALEVGKDLARFPLDAAIAVGRYAEQLNNLTTETGLSAAEQQAYNVVLRRTGLGLQDLSGMWRLLSSNVIAARDPLSDAALKFRQLGIQLSGSEGPNEVLQLVAEKLSTLPDGFRKNTLAVELLGRSGAQFLPAFKDGLSGAAEAAKRLSTVLSDEAIVKSAAFDDATDNLTLAWEGFTHQIGALAAPALTTVVEGMTAGTAQASKFAAEMNKSATATEGLAAMLALASTFTARGVGPGAPTPGGTKTLPVGAIPTDDAFTEALAASGRGLITPGDDQAAKARKISQRSQQLQFDRAHMDELQPGLASTFDITTVMAREKSDAASRARPDLSGLNELQKGIAAIRDLMHELDANEALQLVTHNLEVGHAAVLASVDGWKSYRDGLNDATDSARVLEAAQTQVYQMGSLDIGAADAARRLSFARLEAEEAQKRQTILDTFGVSERGQQKLSDLETQTSTQRMAIVRQFPNFFEQQMQSIVSSNTFSVGQIVTTWTSGVAGAIVNGGNFIAAAWQSTQLALVQGALNTGVQLAAQWALRASLEMGILTAQAAAKLGLVSTSATAEESAKTGIATAGEVARLGVAVATNKLISTSVILSLGAMATVGQAAIAIMLAVTEAAAAMMGGIAAALTAGIITAPLAPAVVAAAGILAGAGAAGAAAATAGIQAALGGGLVGSVAGGGFATGGIGNFGGGTQATLHGQEAIIPLDGRGARFMNQLGFGGGGRAQTIKVPVYLDGRQIALAVSDHQMSALRTMGAL